jgi:hypothetical protein
MPKPDNRTYDLDSQLKLALETEIITAVSVRQDIGIREAMDIYYRSKLSGQINAGEYGIQYLDAQYLADDLIENEQYLFA